MKMISLCTILCTILLSVSIFALDSSQIDFITRLVNDVRSHEGDYISFVETAHESIPPAVTSLAIQIQTYTDDSYTTLFQKESVEVSQLQSFATGLPWYGERIATSGSSGSSGLSASQTSFSSSSSSSATSSKGNANVVFAPVGSSLLALVAALF